MKYFLPLILFITLTTGCQKDNSLKVEILKDAETPENLLFGKWSLDYKMLFDDPDNPEDGERHDDDAETTLAFEKDGTLVIERYTTDTDDEGNQTEPTRKSESVTYILSDDKKTITIIGDGEGQEIVLEIETLDTDHLVLEHTDDTGKTITYLSRIESEEDSESE